MKTLLLHSLILLSASSLIAATVTWDGDSSNNLGDATNWSSDVAPNSADDFVVDNNTGFTGTGNFLSSLTSGNTEFGSLDFSAAGTGSNAGRFGVRAGASFGRFQMSGDMIFSGVNLTQDITLQGAVSNSLSYAALGGNRQIVNNTSASVEFGNTNGFAFAGWQSSSRQLRFNGSGDFIIGSTATFETSTSGNLRRLNIIGTAEGFTGNLTFENGTTFSTGAGAGLRVEGGTITVGGTDTIAADEQIGFGGGTSVSRTLDLSGLDQSTNDLSNLASFASAGSNTLIVDSVTDVQLTDLRVTGVGIDITGWDEGSTSIVFSELGDTFYGGTVADGAAFDSDLTINGGTAYMVDAGGGNFAVSAVPEPSTYALLLGVAVVGIAYVRRRS